MGNIAKIVSDTGSEYGGQILCSSADTTIMSTPTGRNFYLRTLHVSNTNAAADRIRIYDGTVAAGTLKFELEFAANESLLVTDLKGVIFTSDLHGIAETTTAWAMVGGEAK